jgi:WD40 repeat protein
LNPDIFGTVGSDAHYRIWDIRTPKQFVQCQKASEDELLSFGFSYFNENLFCTGGEESGNFHVWDIRLPRSALNDFVYHKESVTSIEWNPNVPNLILSTSLDGQVFIWDHNKTGEEQARHDYADGPPELLFPHEMHQKKRIEEGGWCPHPGFERMVVSVD